MDNNYIDNTIKSMKLALEKNNVQETEEYKRLQKLEEKRGKENEKNF